MRKFENIIKIVADKLIALLALLLLSPLYIYLMLRVKASSEGPVFFKQERLGQYGHPFLIYKFRTMQPNAEQYGPTLASLQDTRITPLGRTMRRYHLDELPQFWNVLKGDMSLVGPRPERQFYIDQIMKRAPEFRQLLALRPGITSLGMTKYGYASNVDQMIERLQYDKWYYDHLSTALDFKILVETVKITLRGSGI
ncbi:sugar transferase [Bacteroidia bacterium]|nr:sugar transferase [Bacteroidia bacterium]